MLGRTCVEHRRAHNHQDSPQHPQKSKDASDSSEEEGENGSNRCNDNACNENDYSSNERQNKGSCRKFLFCHTLSSRRRNSSSLYKPGRRVRAKPLLAPVRDVGQCESKGPIFLSVGFC